MEQKNKNKSRILVFISLALIIFSIYSSTMNYAYATSVLAITMPNSGATQFGVWQSTTTLNKAWFSVIEGGTIKVNIKANGSDTISATITTTDSTTGGALAYVDDQDAVYLFTNNAVFKIGNSCNCILARFNTTSFNLGKEAYWDDTHNFVYVLKSAGYVRLTPAGFSSTSATFTSFTPNFSFISSIATDMDIDEDNNYMFVVNSGSDNAIRINLATNLNDLNFTAGTALTWYGVSVDSTNNFVYVTVSDNTQLKKYAYDGTLITSFSSIVAIPRLLEINSEARRMYVMHASTDQVVVWDIDSLTQVGSTLGVCDNPLGHPDTKVTTTDARVIVVCQTGSIDSIITDTSFGGAQQEQGFCDLPENENILRCRLGDDEFTGVGDTVGEGIINIGCNVIFVDCSESDDPAQNGMGLLAFIASIFVIIGMFYWAMGRDAFGMHIFIWVVIIIALSAFFTVTGLIDPIFLILSVIAIIALATPKLVGLIQNRGFGGGSSE